MFSQYAERFRDFGDALVSNFAALIVAAAVLVLLIVFRSRLARFVGRILRRILKKWPVAAEGAYMSVYHPLRFFFVMLGLYLFFNILQPESGLLVFSTSFMNLVSKVMRISNICVLTWILLDFTPTLTTLTIKVTADNKVTSEVGIKFVANVIRLCIGALSAVIIIDELGYNVTGIITGLGLGGLTLSLAAKNTASNLFSGFEIVTDKPFDVGDYIKSASAEGTVEDMTMRSTRIRTPDDLLIAVPNSVLMNEAITNYSEMGKRYVGLTIGLTYDTPSEVLQKCISDIYKSLKENEAVDKKRLVVRFSGFNDSSLDIRIIYFTVTTDYDQYLAVNEEINFKIRDIVEKNSASFAYPMTRLYMEDDPKDDKKNKLT